MAAPSMEALVSLCKRRGFIFPNSDIYGGLQGVYDYGPLGVELKNNVKAAWWRAMVYERDDVEGLDAAILTNRKVLRYSGHEETFSDPLVDCRDCKGRFRADHLDGNVCPSCGGGNLTPPRPFNLMFRTQVGPVDDGSSFAYLRPETAQAIFVNFKNVIDATSRRPPFGIAQIGKAFRNEITPRNFIFRVREFEQMELEFFVMPGEDETWHEYWKEARLAWWHAQGLAPEQLRVEDVPPEELSHYSKRTYDLYYRFPHGWEELEGVANRTDYDLGSHTRYQEQFDLASEVHENPESNARLAVQAPGEKAWVVPFVIEPSAGVDRGVLAILNEAYTEETLPNGSERTVLRFRPHLAPVKAAVLPVKKNHEGIVATAKRLKADLQALGIGRMMYENTGNIGKGYRRHDEIGTPLCVTIDFETIEGDGTVTVRDRDSTEQERIPLAEVPAYVSAFYQDR